MSDQSGIAMQTVSAKKVTLLAAFGGLIMFTGFITHNWTKISTWLSNSAAMTRHSTDSTPATIVSVVDGSLVQADTDFSLPRGVAAESQARNNADKFAALLNLPVSERSPAKFRGLQTMMEMPLKTDEWSRQIFIPSAKQSWYYIHVDPPNGYFIWFDDGFVLEAVPQKGISDFGTRSSPFRLLAKTTGQHATIKISSKPFKPTQDP